MKVVFPEPIQSLPQADIPLDGLTAFLSQGENHQILFMQFEKDAELAEHSHAGQFGIVVEGQLDIVIDGEPHTFRKGDRYYIPAGVRHASRIHAGYADITFFDQPDRYALKSGPIIVEQEFDAPVEKVWRAITDRDQMVQWFFEQIPGFEPEVGYETEFAVVLGDQTYVHRWKVTQVDPHSRISYSWRYADVSGEGAVTWDLWQRGAGAGLRLTFAGNETFPQDDPVFRRESGEQGWRYFINERLKSFLDR